MSEIITVTVIRGGRLITDGRCIKGPLWLRGGRILSVGAPPQLPAETKIEQVRELDAGGGYVLPGFIDLHVHGGGGCEFIDGTPEAVAAAANIHARHGTTTLFPTLSSYDMSDTVKALDAVAEAMRGDLLLPHVGGVHLEGPYFSPRQAGAQDPSHIRPPKKEEYLPLLDAYPTLIRRWSYAPELEGTDEFLEALTARGVIASAGHTDASLADVRRAMEGGMHLITHLYSCTSTVTRRGGFRIPGVVESAFLFDGLDVEIIADGCHLPPEMIAMIHKIKGAAHVCLVTDAIRYGCLDSTEDVTDPNGNVPYIIEDGVAKLSDRSAFAGSIASMDRLLRVAVQRAGIPLTEAVRMVTETPARIMGLSSKGRLAPGLDADVVITDDELNVRDVLVSGRPL